MADFKLQRVYNFNTIKPGILQSQYKNMKVVSIMDAKEATAYVDVAGIHAQIKTSITGVNIPGKWEDLTYIKFATPGGDFAYLASEYLTGVVEVTSRKLVIEINNYTSSDYVAISDALKSLGYENMKFDIKDA